MPDRDIFRMTVERGWKSVSRRILSSDLGDWEIGTAIWAAAKDFRRTGCLGLDKIVHVRIDEAGNALPPEQAVHHLQELRRYHGVKLSEEAVRGASRVLIDHMNSVTTRQGVGSSSSFDREVAREIIIEHIRGKAMPPALQWELVVSSGKLTNQEFIERERELSDRLKKDPRIDQLAGQLVRDPSGSEIRLSHNPRRNPDQSEIISWELS